jgi:hypothetical protein
MKKVSLTLGALGILGVLASCANRARAPVAATAPSVKWPVKSPDFVDLLPDWQVREITPIFASGGFVAKTGTAKEEGDIPHKTITISGSDFQGYETALYSLKPRPGGGVEPALESVETNKAGQVTKEVKPRVLLFQFPRRVRYIRLLYLLRVSTADHNMAILGSNDVDELNNLTKQVQSDPAGGCRNMRRAYCSWVAQGIAVNAGPSVPR